MVPDPSLVTEVAAIDPPPATATFTVAPGIALSNASRTVAVSGATVWPTVPLIVEDPVATIFAGAPGPVVTLMTIGVSPDTVMVRVFSPIVLPSVQVPTDVDGVFDFVGALAMEPPPSVTEIVTETPPSGFPSLSLTTKVGAVDSGNPAAGVPLGSLESSIEAGVAFGPDESPQADRDTARAATTI